MLTRDFHICDWTHYIFLFYFFGKYGMNRRVKQRMTIICDAYGTVECNISTRNEKKKMNVKYNSIEIYVVNGYIFRFVLVFDYYYFNLWAVAWMTIHNTPQMNVLEYWIGDFHMIILCFNWNFANDANYSMLCHFCPIQICKMHIAHGAHDKFVHSEHTNGLKGRERERRSCWTLNLFRNLITKLLIIIILKHFRRFKCRSKVSSIDFPFDFGCFILFFFFSIFLKKFSF